MKKEKLIEALEEAARTEEAATTIYLQHLDAITSRLISDRAFEKKIKDSLLYLIDGNKLHKNRCLEMLSKLKKEKSDDI